MRMTGICCFHLVMASVIFIATPASVVAAPPDGEYLAAKQHFQKEIKKKDPALRVAAIDAFVEVPHKESVDLLIKRCLPDDHQDVRDAMRRGLRKLAADRSISQFMFDELKKQLKRQTTNEASSIELLRALLVAADATMQSDLVKLLDDTLASSKTQPIVPISLIDELAQQGDKDAERSVELLAKVALFDKHFGYRRCVVQAMTQIRQPEAVTYLIDLLPKTKGLIQYDVIEYLTRLTGKKYGDSDRSWSIWWKENQSQFEFPSTDKPLSEVNIEEQQQTYYGIPICAKRIVFVLDTSGSMRGQPIELAKQALLKAIDSLPESVSFDVVMFDASATTWSPRLIAATRDAKREASQVVIDRGLSFGTVSSAALNAAFALEPEAIYFLSDGEPTDGAPTQIVHHYTQFNRTRRVSIHTIGVVTERNGSPGLSAFMQPLAEKNYGKFRLVE